MIVVQPEPFDKPSPTTWVWPGTLAEQSHPNELGVSKQLASSTHVSVPKI